MKVGDKYVIEIEEVIRRNGAPQIARIKGFNALVFDKQGLEKLEPYEDESDAYDKGLIDAWEAVRKIIKNVLDGGYSSDVLREIFGASTVQSIITFNTAAEAIAKIKAYEEQQKQDAEIKVGDEVYSDAFDDKGIVTHITADKVSCVCIICNGFTMMKVGNVSLHKTGRHFPQIAEVLAELRGKE